MTYAPLIPQDLPAPAIIVNQIRSNFSQYATIFSNNHSSLNDSNQGKHTNVIMQQQLSDPSNSGGFDSLYGKSVTSNSSTSQELFVRIPQFLPDQFPNTPMQLTFNSVNISGPQYQSFLSGGYILYWGKIPSATTINTTITLVPAPSKILCVIPNASKLGTPNGSTGPTAPVRTSVSVNANNFEFTISATNPLTPPGTGDIYWLCIAAQ